mmetsp:Transcript_92882/g.268209  ORF Transcript_92882/g.268209 Transcript_92882/m.268209 type:complete len:206 (-) Transcript_92882:140-757(-)
MPHLRHAARHGEGGPVRPGPRVAQQLVMRRRGHCALAAQVVRLAHGRGNVALAAERHAGPIRVARRVADEALVLAQALRRRRAGVQGVVSLIVPGVGEHVNGAHMRIDVEARAVHVRRDDLPRRLGPRLARGGASQGRPRPRGWRDARRDAAVRGRAAAALALEHLLAAERGLALRPADAEHLRRGRGGAEPRARRPRARRRRAA